MYGIITKEESKALSDKQMAEYKFANDCELAFDLYENKLLKSGCRDLDDIPTRWIVSRMFFGAKTQEDLDRYSAMTPEELVALEADMAANREDGPERQGEQNP